ncbi:MAG: hypothetical protein SVO26_00385 [Chloroflexota bacterium]|nr:hypothetical protein [Chloroflexota bacterium]
MDIDKIIDEARLVAFDFGLAFRVADITDNTVNLRLHFDTDLFVQVYANPTKEKLNLTLVFRGKRLLGADSEGGRYHLHPANNPEAHIFTNENEGIRRFVISSLNVLDDKKLL